MSSLGSGVLGRCCGCSCFTPPALTRHLLPPPPQLHILTRPYSGGGPKHAAPAVMWRWLARAKGLSRRGALWLHALRPALIPVVTILGLDMAGLLSGTLITEQIFGVDGIGRFAIESLRNDDLPIIMGTVPIGCVPAAIMNLIVAIAYSFPDPRVRLP